MLITVTLNAGLGSGLGPTFSVTTDLDNVAQIVTLAELLDGIDLTFTDGSSIVFIESLGECDTILTLLVNQIPPTTTTTSTSSTTTTTTTSICTCPEGYLLTENLDGCYTIDSISATPPIAAQTAVEINYYLYSSSGTIIYDNGYGIDGLGTYSIIDTSNSFWKNPLTTTDGPMNRNALWTSITIADVDQTVGFIFCINVPESKYYYLGIGFDNYARISIDLQLLLTTETYTLSNFLYWKIYPIYLNAGNHEIEIIGVNIGGPLPNPAALAFEFYDNTSTEIETATSYADLNVLYKSADYIGIDIQVGSEGYGYSCPEDYTLSICDGSPICKKRIEIPCGSEAPTTTTTTTIETPTTTTTTTTTEAQTTSTSTTLEPTTTTTTTYSGPYMEVDYFASSLSDDSWTAFMDNTAYTYNNVTYITYGGLDSNAYIISHDHLSGEWSTPVRIPGENSLALGDGHGTPSLVVDVDGYIHVTYDGHNSTIQYYRSSNPEDITSWDTMTFFSGTYTQLIVFSTGRLFRFYRKSNQYVWVQQYSDNNGTTWTSQSDITSDFAYSVFKKGIGDTIHVAIIGNNITTYRRNVYYLFYNGTNWTDIGGTTKTLPVVHPTDATALLAYNSGNYNCLSVQLDYDESNKPFIVFPKDLVEDGGYDSQYDLGLVYYASGWNYVNFGLDRGFRESYVSAITIISDNEMYIYTGDGDVSTSTGSIKRYVSINHGATWSLGSTIISGKIGWAKAVNNHSSVARVVMAEYEGNINYFNDKGYLYNDSGFVTSTIPGTSTTTTTTAALTTTTTTTTDSGTTTTTTTLDSTTTTTSSSSTTTTTTTSSIALKTSLISVWELDETSGSVADDSHGSNDGTIFNALVNQAGKIGTSYYFDGNGDYISVPASSSFFFSSSSSFSISIWMKRNAISALMNLIRVDAGSVGRDLWAIRIMATNYINVLFGDSSGTLHSSESSITVTDTNWHHIVATVTPSTVTIYIDGTQRGQQANGSTTWSTTSDVLTIGIYDQFKLEAFSGNIDQTAVWNKALSTDEIASLYNSGNGLVYTLW